MKDKKKNDQILQEDQATDDLEIIELTDSADADDAEFIELTDSADKSFSEQEKITEPDSDDDAEIAVIPEDSDDPVLLDDIAGEILAGDEELIEFDEMISLDDIAEEDVMEDEEVIDLDAADVTDHQNVTDSLPDDVSPGDEGEFAESEIEKSAAMNDMDENIADSADIGTDEDEDDEDVIELDMKNIRASSDSDEPVLLRESAGSTDENENADDFDDAETIFAPTDLDDKAGKDDDIVALEDEATIIAPPDLDETILLHDTAEDKRFAKSFYGAGTAEKEDDIVALEDEATIIAPPDLDETIFLRDDDERQATHVPKQGLGNENEPPVRDSDSYSDDEATIIAPPDLDETIFLGDDSEESDQQDDDDIIDLNDEAAIIEKSDPDETIFLRDDGEKHVSKQGLGNEKKSDPDETIFLRDDDEKQATHVPKQGLGNENEPPVRDSDSYSDDEATIIAPPDLDETIFLGDDDEKHVPKQGLGNEKKQGLGNGNELPVRDSYSDDEATIIAPPDLDETIFLGDDDEKHVPKQGLGNEKKQGLGNENELPVRDSYSDDEATIIAPPDLDETIFLGDDAEKPDQQDDDDIIDLNDEAAIIEQSDFDETIFLRDDDEKHVPKQGLGNEKKQGLGNEKRTPERGNRNEPPVRYSDSYSGDEATIIAPPDLDGGDFFGAELKKQDQQDDDDIIDLSDEESIKPDSDETIFIQDVARKAVRQKEDDSNGLSDPDGTILFQDEAKKATEAYDIIELSPENIVAPPPLEDPTLSGEVISKRNKKVADHGILHSDRDEGTGERPEDTGTPITDIDDVIRLADKASTDFKPAAAGKNLSAESDDILFGSEAEALLSESPYLSEDIPEIRDDKSESQRRDKGLSDLIADDLKQQSGSPESASDDREGNQYIPAEIPARVLQKEDDTAAEAQPSDSKDIKEEIHQKKPSDSAPRVRHLPDSVSLPPPEQLEAILEQVIKKVFSEKMFSEKIENKLVEVIEKAVANEMDRLKDVLFEDLADED